MQRIQNQLRTRAHTPKATALVLVVLQATSYALAYGAQVFLLHRMGRTAFGEYAFAVSAATVLATLANLGLPLAAIRFVAQYRAQHNWPALRGFVTRSYQWVALASLLVAGAVGLPLFLMSQVTTNAALFGAALIPSMALAGLQSEILRADQRALASFIPNRLLQPVVTLIIAIGLGAWHGQLAVSTVLISLLLGIGIATAVQAWQLARGVQSEIAAHATHSDFHHREWLRVALVMSAAGWLLVMLNQLDILLVGWLLNTEAVAAYDTVIKVSLPAGFAINAVNIVIAPRIVALHSAGNRPELQRTVTRGSRLAFFISLVLGIGLALLGVPILGIFDAAFVSAQPALVALLAGQVLNAAFGPVGNLIVLTGQQRKVLAPFAAALVFSLAANLVVIPAFGAVGAAVVRTIGILIWNAWMHLIVWRDLGVASNAFATSPVSARV